MSGFKQSPPQKKLLSEGIISGGVGGNRTATTTDMSVCHGFMVGAPPRQKAGNSTVDGNEETGSEVLAVSWLAGQTGQPTTRGVLPAVGCGG